MDTRGEGGQTALMSACLRGHAEVALLLLESGADVLLGEKDGYTCLHGAGFQGRPEVVRRVLASFPNTPNTAHKDGFHPIHRACWGRETRHADAVKAFVEHGVPHDVRASSGETPLDIARRIGNAQTIAVLEKAAALPDL